MRQPWQKTLNILLLRAIFLPNQLFSLVFSSSRVGILHISRREKNRDAHLGIVNYPRGREKFFTWARNISSEVLFRPSVGIISSLRRDLKTSTWESVFSYTAPCRCVADSELLYRAGVGFSQPGLKSRTFCTFVAEPAQFS